jgi:hypothetical protein
LQAAERAQVRYWSCEIVVIKGSVGAKNNNISQQTLVRSEHSSQDSFVFRKVLRELHHPELLQNIEKIARDNL